LSADPPENSPFLSIDETREVVRGLEESFRTTLFTRLRLAESEVVLRSLTTASSTEQLTNLPTIAVPEVHVSRKYPNVKSEALNKIASSAQAPPGSVIQPMLDSHGWSVHEFAKRAGVDFNTVKLYLKGMRRPYPSTRKKMADALGIRLEDLP
jgi:lambda repressor-like predicted transcriptional regulator